MVFVFNYKPLRFFLYLNNKYLSYTQKFICLAEHGTPFITDIFFSMSFLKNTPKIFKSQSLKNSNYLKIIKHFFVISYYIIIILFILEIVVEI